MDIMDILNNKKIERIGKWMDNLGIFYVPVKMGWKIISKFFGFNYKKHDIYMIGQSHLDACWLWTWKETVRKNDITFSNALKHLKDYPFFKFSCSSPQYFYWMEKYYPQKFEEIKKYVSEGRIELVGGMWIEPDVIIPNGESLVRQRLYGQRYYLEKFGKLSKVGWLSDTFGYCWTLPQILKKSGSEYFYTNKMQWNDTNNWPFILFYWQSPDGSKVMTYTFSYSVNVLFQNPNLGEFTKISRLFDKPNQVFTYKDGFNKVEKLKGKEYMREFGLVYGLGDGGGGPVRSEIIFFKELYRQNVVKGFITMEEFFKILKKYKDKIPIWNDEMYLEFHRGCYTSHSWIKTENRNAEQLLYKTEIFSSIATKFGFVYPQKKITNLYKRLLFNQFHDILPGSAIPEVYKDTKHDFEVIKKSCNEIIKLALETIKDNLELQNGILVFNPLNWSRSMNLSLKLNDKYLIRDKNNNIIPIQILENGEYIFTTPDLPSLGLTLLKLEKTDQIPEFKTDLILEENEKEIILENQFIKLKINKKSGNIKSIFHKNLNREILTSEGNELQIFKEKFGNVGFTAWNLDKNYFQRPQEIFLDSIIIREKGPIRLKIEINKRIKNSKIKQSIMLYSNADLIDFNINLEFYEKWNFVKVAFPVDVESDTVNCEIPFGIISRSTMPENSAQSAKFEIPSQRWLDVSNNKFGVTLINRSRYGFDVKYDPKLKNIIRMSILRVPKYPPKGSPLGSIIPSKKFHDQVNFSVDYALYIHKGNWIDAKSYKKGIEFNISTEAWIVNKNHHGIKLPIKFISIEPDNIILSALKKCEDEDGSFILRVYETAGIQSDCKITFSDLFQVKNAEEVDLLELNPKPLKYFDQNSLSFQIHKYEIKTIKIHLE
ncbi:MAG: alpha-mannosidase [Candidatus Helarchaeota archaeon]